RFAVEGDEAVPAPLKGYKRRLGQLERHVREIPEQLHRHEYGRRAERPVVVAVNGRNVHVSEHPSQRIQEVRQQLGGLQQLLPVVQILPAILTWVRRSERVVQHVAVDGDDDLLDTEG